jgi:predicted XRE-type DNA-binding protein
MSKKNKAVVALHTEVFTASDGEQIEVTRGSGNVFADLGLEDAEELQLKAGLIHGIKRTIERRNLTQSEAARLAGIDQPALSRILSSKGLKCTVEKLFVIHNRLGNKVEVRVHADADARMLLVA